MYLGIPTYSLRARENGIKRAEVVEAVEYVHKRGKKVYLTANIIPHNHKVEPFVEYVGELLELCSPDVCSHSCRWKYKMHERVDSAAQDAENKEQAAAEYVPVQGDFYVEEMERPGQFMQIDEDENGTYLMNAKDLCAMEYLDEMRAAGVESFKVEGRSKSVYYVAVVARAYRRAIDDMMAGRPLDPDNLNEVYSTSNRGFVAGFLKGTLGEAGQNYETTRSVCLSHRFAAEPRSYDPVTGLTVIDVRNPIRIGSRLELIEPDRTVPFVVEQLVGRDGEATDVVHGGIDGCQIRLPEAPGEFALLREKLD